MAGAATVRSELIRIGRLLYDRQLVVAAEGNLSVRLGGDRFLVTAAGTSLGFLADHDLVTVNREGRAVSPEARGPGAEDPAAASSEWPLHREIYARRPDVQAVCHAHPPWATAFAAAGLPLEGCLLPEIVATLGSVPLAAYGTPGTEEVPASVRDLVAGHDALLLANHGVVTLGADLAGVFGKLESVERLAQVTLLARLAGGEQRLSRPAVAALQETRDRSRPPCLARGEERAPAPADSERQLEAAAGRLAREILAELAGED